MRRLNFLETAASSFSSTSGGGPLVLLLADLLHEVGDHRADLLAGFVARLERVEHDFFGQATRARLDHRDRVLGRSERQVELALAFAQHVHFGVEDDLLVDVADTNRTHRTRERDRADVDRRERADHRRNVRIVDSVEREARSA